MPVATTEDDGAGKLVEAPTLMGVTVVAMTRDEEEEGAVGGTGVAGVKVVRKPVLARARDVRTADEDARLLWVTVVNSRLRDWDEDGPLMAVALKEGKREMLDS